MQASGKVWRYGDHVDTDVIIPARYLNIQDPDELATHAMEDIDTTFAGQVKPGEIIVAGKNFGCGSSREHAPLVLKQKGVSCVVAESFARIFYRNAINIGLPVVELGAAVENIKAGHELTLDMSKGLVTDETTGQSWTTKPLPAFVQELVDAGGLIAYIKGGGMA